MLLDKPESGVEATALANQILEGRDEGTLMVPSNLTILKKR